MIKYLLSFSLLLSLTGIPFAQTANSWSKKATFGGEKRERAIGFSIGDYGYAGMGEDTASWTHNDLWRYDPTTDTWSQMMNCPGPARRNAVAVAIGDKGYVGMGIDSSNSFMGTIHQDWWQYDPVANNWVQKANYPGGYNIYNQTSATEGIYYGTAFEINGKGYVCGGKMGPDWYATDLWEYDPNLDSWTRKADFPGGDRYQLSSFGVNGYGYVCLGVDHDLFNDDVWQYDPVLNVWTQKSDFPGVDRGAASSFVLGQHGFIVFGSDGGYKDELWEYNPFSDSWSIRANFPGGERKNAFTFTIGDTAYAGTGKGPTGLKRNFYAYYPLPSIGLEENNDLLVKIYPNPIQDKAIIEIGNYDLISHYVIFDLQGKSVAQGKISGFNTNLERENISNGIFILALFNQDNQAISQQKIIFK